MSNIKKMKEKMTLHPIMTFIILILCTMLVSGFLNLLGVSTTYNKVNENGTYTPVTVAIESMISLRGIKYIFSSTVSNFALFTPLSMLLIILIGIGIMEKSGFLKTAFTLLTRHLKKNTVTFAMVLICVLLSIVGDLGYAIMIPISALLFLHGKRNPIVGIIAAFAGLTCGTGISVFLTSVDSSLMKQTLYGASVLDPNYTLSTFAFIAIMTVAVIAVSIAVTEITERIVAPRLGKYEGKEEKEKDVSKREMKGLVLALIAGAVYLIIFIYNIIPGLPLSGNLLDYSQTFYIDKLFGDNSFFSNGFVFLVTMLFVIWGFFYGIGAKTIKNNKDFCDDLGHSLDGIGKTIILILFASVLINVFKKSNIGTVIVASLANMFRVTDFGGIPLIILLFIIVAFVTLLVPTPIAKWSIMAGSVVPIMMTAGITPEFTQVIFRFAESMTMGLTPVFAYFVVYLAYVNKYNTEEKPISLFKTLKYQIPYTIGIGGILLALLILWYIIGLPIGVSGTPII